MCKYLAMNPERDPRKDYYKDAGHVHLNKKIAGVPFEVERDL